MTEAELLFTQILSCDRVSLYLNKKNLLNKRNSSMVSSVLKRRISGEPIQYVLGKTEFMGFEFKVNKDVFIPRPETEILVETAVKQYSVVSRQSSVKNILDLGTGSGCIAISLAKLLPEVQITAVDISEAALDVARENAKMLEVSEKIAFLKSNLFESIGNNKYALCITNPPYIPSAEIGFLEPEIGYEPLIALDGGIDGLDFYRRLLRDLPRYIIDGGLLIAEIGFDQKDGLRHLIEESGAFKVVEVVKDYCTLDRIVVARKT
ncbi:MAG: peptide chain release factor N(5)-glutamine methyltransferase [Candidatus Omnitrophica bacterium]|nr:peptide chain release factor N(5)-glutamine methyltransferase [Candidatus Omnitrophota bacterium]